MRAKTGLVLFSAMPPAPRTVPNNKEVLSKYLIRPGIVGHTCNPSTLEGGGGQIMRSEVQDQPGQLSKTLSLLKIQKKKKKKLARCGGSCL